MTSMAAIANPYLAEAMRHQCRCRPEMRMWRLGPDANLGCTICVPSHSPAWTERIRVRHALAPKYAWAIPSDEALAAIAGHGPVVEIGAGTGYWASLLAPLIASGGRRVAPIGRTIPSAMPVAAYDIKPGKNGWTDGSTYYDVRRGGSERASDYPERTLFLCWPPYDDPMADDSLAAYAGSVVAYIGESDGGCCASEAFFARLAAAWDVETEIDLPQWWGVHDALTIYRRKA